jgi:outer membrane protein assembly factor BamC
MHAANTPQSRLGHWTVLAVAAALASGCTILQEDKIDYKSAQRGSTLEVPPDLTQLSRDSRYAMPGGTATASGYQGSAASPAPAPTAIQAAGDVRIERAGAQRWLVVNRSPEQLWGPVRDFWKENGFELETDQEKLGIMETDWAENRAKIPQDFIRATIGKVFDSLYSTGERDRFRTRFERNTTGGTEIYITHRGMIEVYTSVQKDQTVWQPRPSDVELETEFLRRLMVKLGVTEEQAKAVAATAPRQGAARQVSVDGAPAIQFEDNFDRAWRRVGLSLDRTGFTVEDRDRSQGVYYVRFVAARPDNQEKPGFLGRIFGRSAPEVSPDRHRVVVRSNNDLTTVTVLDSQARPDSSTNAQTIVRLLAEDLR